MSEQEDKKPLSFLERMKKRAEAEKNSYYDLPPTEAGVSISTCPNCGAGRAKMDGLTKCAYCNYEFLSVELSDGLNITKEDNSR
jgi:uncharacterized protein (DUF983 family)